MRIRPLHALALVLAWTAGLAHAGTAIIVNKNSGIDQLSAEQVQKIFLGKINMMQKQGRLMPLDLPEGTARERFYSKATGKSPVQIKSHWAMMVFTGRAQPPEEVASEKAMLEQVARNPLAIGYVDQTQVDDSVKTVCILP